MAEIPDIDDDFAVDSIDPAPRADGKAGPPDSWVMPSWYDRQDNDWYWKGKPDPCPVRAQGHIDGQYIFVTLAGELRRFSSSQLHGRGGLVDLFGGQLWWPLRHFRDYDLAKGRHEGSLQRERCIAALIRACLHPTKAGYYDGATPRRSIGTWRGPDGQPIVHAGERIFYDGEIHQPGALIGDALYVIGGSRQAPAYINEGRDGPRDLYSWEPSPVEACHKVAADLEEWHWQDLEARDLFLGGLFCDMLGDAPLWRPHKFVRAPAGSGKSTLLKYVRALLGGAAHPIQRSYSKAFLEQRFSGTSSALLLDEMESDSETDRVRHLFELIRLLSDDGASGGRGTSGGQAREFDVHGTVTMVATVTEQWRPADRSRIVFLELKPLRDRADHPPAPPEAVAALIDQAVEASAGLRARAIARYGLFAENLALVRKRILELGGSPRDADQLGHLIAGWAVMTGDEAVDDDTLRDLARFKPYILTVTDADDQADDPSELLNILYGLPAQTWKGGEQLTVGQVVARARENDNADFRRALLSHGLRLEKLPGETWQQAWLAIANKHPGLDRLFADYRQFQGPKRAQILSGLRRTIDGVTHEAKPSEIPLRFAGPQSRALLIPPELLPALADERQEADQ